MHIYIYHVTKMNHNYWLLWSSHIIKAGRIDGVGLSVPDWQYHYIGIIAARLRMITTE